MTHITNQSKSTLPGFCWAYSPSSFFLLKTFAAKEHHRVSHDIWFPKRGLKNYCGKIFSFHITPKYGHRAPMASDRTKEMRQPIAKAAALQIMSQVVWKSSKSASPPPCLSSVHNQTFQVSSSRLNQIQTESHNNFPKYSFKRILKYFPKHVLETRKPMWKLLPREIQEPTAKL